MPTGLGDGPTGLGDGPTGLGEGPTGLGEGPSRPDAVAPGRPAPLSTYRVQLRPGFGFDQAAGLVGYLADLGVTHFYASPYLQAAKGSSHGYDVVDPTRINEELGGAVGHAAFCAELSRRGLGQVLDLVPNHMAITGGDNRWWWDVLENGPSSRYAYAFDVDWDPPEAKLRNTVLMPVLGDHYGRVLEAGLIRLRRDGGTFTVHYYDQVLPVSPSSLDTMLHVAADRCESDELGSLATALARLPHSSATDRDSVVERHRDKEVLRRRLARLCQEDPEVVAAVDAVVAETSASPDALDALLERQNYRLAYWRTAGRELDYRRFFDVNNLVGVRVEDELVFADTHGLVLRWLRDGVMDGLRIDHPDGLRDPEGYLSRLCEGSAGAWTVVEKILEPKERLPPRWPVAGTTGYDFLNRVLGLFVDPGGEQPLTELYAELTGAPTDWKDLAHGKKHLVMREVLAADINRLTGLFVQVCERHRRYRDFTRHELHEALREVLACFPVYRTYVQAEQGRVSADDVAHVTEAVAHARDGRPDLDQELFSFLEDLLLLRRRGEVEGELVMRLQQASGPVMAKGVEDTAFYCFNRLVALNEVGGDPSRFGTSLEEFHQANLEVSVAWPSAMLSTSTHDTKRSEDVRARIALLSEIPTRWGEAVRRWMIRNDRHRVRATTDGQAWPDRNAEYLLYQVLVGAHPLPVDRAVAYMEKASREAKEHTSWINPLPAYDQALRAFVEALAADEGFAAELDAFVAPLVEPGRVNSLAQQLAKLTGPGVPDVYQGTELWDLSLVDPDNRRPVDWDLRRRLLDELDHLEAKETWARADEGLPKLAVTACGLRLRRRLPELFCAGSTYTPLRARGERADHVVAWRRSAATGEGGAITVVPRLVLGLDQAGGWGGTVLDLPPGNWHDELAGNEHSAGPVRLADLLGDFPVALLVTS